MLVPLAAFGLMLIADAGGESQAGGRATARAAERLQAERELCVLAAEYEATDPEWGPLPDEQLSAFYARLWDAFESWTAAYLEEHQGCDEAGLQRAVEELGVQARRGPPLDDSVSFEVSAVRLSERPAAVVVLANWARVATFFVVTEVAGRMSVAWSVRPEAARGFPRRDEIGRWAYVSGGFHDGSFTARVSALPPTAGGAPRFLVDAITMPDIGLVRPGQVSMWEWDGRGARPELITTYETHWESHSVRTVGDSIQVRANEQFETFYTCGS